MIPADRSMFPRRLCLCVVGLLLALVTAAISATLASAASSGNPAGPPVSGGTVTTGWPVGLAVWLVAGVTVLIVGALAARRSDPQPKPADMMTQETNQPLAS